ncbi:SAM-dependent methyltransferase [Pseudonocardia saturnea]
MSVALPVGNVADGYTTRAQADDLVRRLDLHPGMRLLELGSGRGWPGVYLAQTSGSHVVLTDLPAAGLRVAAARAIAEGLTGRYSVATADGAHLRSPPRASTRSCMPTSCVDCAPSSPC